MAAQQVKVPPSLLSTTSQPRDQLLQSANLLHLLHHRSKNQHRRSPWYRHFAVFRREVQKLCLELGIALPNKFIRQPRSQHFQHGSRRESRPPSAAQRKRDAVRLAGIRLQYWIDEELIERCYTAFSTLVVQPSFAGLGMVLLGVLGRVCAVVGVLGYLKGLESTEDREGLLENAEEELRVNDGREQEFDSTAVAAQEDLGVVVEASERHMVPIEEETAPRKKRKKGDFMDKLFAGLS